MPTGTNDPRLQHCGFAKLLGDGLEFYVKKYEVTMGRRSKSTQLDVVLGDNMNISRKHACIRFNFEKGAFELVVLGKNGVTVSGVLHTPTSPPLELRSQDFVQMGDKSFYFLLPKDVSRLGLPPAKQRRMGPDHHSASARRPTTPAANGAPDVPTSSAGGKVPGDSASPSPGMNPKWSLTDGSSERSELEYDDMSHSPAVDGLVVSGKGMKNGEMGAGNAEAGSDSPGKNDDLVASPPVVFTHAPSGVVQTAQLYRPGGGHPFA